MLTPSFKTLGPYSSKKCVNKYYSPWIPYLNFSLLKVTKTRYIKKLFSVLKREPRIFNKFHAVYLQHFFHSVEVTHLPSREYLKFSLVTGFIIFFTVFSILYFDFVSETANYLSIMQDHNMPSSIFFLIVSSIIFIRT